MNVLPTPTGPEDEGVAGLLDEAHRDELGPHRPVVGDLGVVVPGLEHHVRVEAGPPGPGARPSRRRGGCTSSENSCSKNSTWVRSWLLARARRSGRVSISWPSLQLAHEDLQLGRDGGGRGAHRPASVVEANSDGSRAKRPWTTTGSGRASGSVVFPGPLEHPRRPGSRPPPRRRGPGGTPASTRSRSPLLHQPEEPVDLAHLGPRQRRVEDGGGVGGRWTPRARRPCARGGRCPGWRRSPCRWACRPGRCSAHRGVCGDGPSPARPAGRASPWPSRAGPAASGRPGGGGRRVDAPWPPRHGSHGGPSGRTTSACRRARRAGRAAAAAPRRGTPRSAGTGSCRGCACPPSSLHQVSARARQSARSTKVSPAKKFFCT